MADEFIVEFDEEQHNADWTKRTDDRFQTLEKGDPEEMPPEREVPEE